MNACRLERFRLRNRAGHAVEDEAVCAIRLRHTLRDDADDDIVRNELARVHKALRFQTGLGAVFDRFAKNVASGNGRDMQLLADNLSLRTLSCSGSSQKNQFHFRSLRLTP